MPNYSDGKIYKIENDKNDLIYFGSTTCGLSQRMAKHRSEHSLCMSKKLEVDLRECRIVLVEKYPCDCVEELRSREAYYIRNFPCVNKVIPDRTKKEYLEDNRGKIYEKQKEWKEKHKEKQKEYFQKRYEVNKVKIIERHKEYREENKEKIKEKNKEYREKNKEKISEKNKEKYTCEKCGSTFRRYDKARHEKSQKHINSLN